MMESFFDWVSIYLSRPTVVAMDFILLFLLIIVMVGVFSLRSKFNELSIAIYKVLDRHKTGAVK